VAGPLALLSENDVERIVEDAYRVLAAVGVFVDNAEGKQLLLAGGATEAAGRLRISETLVRSALATVPSHFLLYDRDGTAAIDIGGSHVHFDPGSAAVQVLDPSTRRSRSARWPLASGYRIRGRARLACMRPRGYIADSE